MMYFTPLKTAVILGLCLLGAILCIPNLFPAPAPWLPWRTVHLGLDLRGGSYLLLEVDMAAVARERLDSLADALRTALRGKVQFQPPQVQPAQNRVLVRLQNPAQVEDAAKLLRDAALASGGTAEYDVTSTASDVSLSLSEAGLRERANAAVQQSIEI